MRARTTRPWLLIATAWLALHSAVASFAATSVESVGMTVSDLESSVRFYSETLGFEKVSEHEAAGPGFERLQGVFAARARVARLRLGEEVLELTEYVTPRGRPIPADSRSTDLWFQHIAIIVSDMDAAYKRLRSAGVEHVSPAPQRLPDWNSTAGGIKAFYFRDPDRHNLEILWFPPDKGDLKWQRKDELFLGIDHTAIGVSNTSRGLAFYRDLVGFRVAGESENFGPEQEKLNQVFAARLRITGMHLSNGPGIELLDYLSPSAGRPMPPDSQANDLWHWQTRLFTDDIEDDFQRLRQAGAVFVSPGAIELPEGRLGFRRGLTVRGPDGHVMQLVEK